MKTLRHLLWLPALAITLAAAEKTDPAGHTGPLEFALAMDLYQARKYAAAREKFTALKQACHSLAAAPDHPATLAGFYEMECCRKLGDLDRLAAALPRFVQTPLTRKQALRQLDLYPLWLLVREKNWPRLEAAAENLTDERLPGDQRAQVAYCHALALEGLGRPADALAAYQTAITADGGGSEEITRQAVLRILQIHLADPGVRAAMKHPDASGQNPAARLDLAEAAALAALFELSLGGETPLPAEFRVFLRFNQTAAPNLR